MDQKYEIMNEIIILITIVILFLFTEDFIDNEIRLGIGMALITIMAISFLINLVPLVLLIKSSICRVGILYKKRQEKKLIQIHLQHRTEEH